MTEIAQAVHDVACAYGSLDAALSMTPRQLSAALLCDGRRRARGLTEQLTVARVAAHGEKKDVDKVLKDLSSGCK